MIFVIVNNKERQVFGINNKELFGIKKVNCLEHRSSLNKTKVREKGIPFF